MQPERVEEVRDWMARARLDLRAAERLLADDAELAEAVAFRYPSDAEEPTTDQVEDGLRYMHQVFSFVSDRLPPETLSQGADEG